MVERMNNSEVLNEFFSGKEAEELITFFNDYIKEKVKGVQIVVMITKKSYWTFENLKDKIVYDGIEWLSDRFFQKNTDFSAYDGKTIAIVDDTMNTGTALLRFYKIMKRACLNSKIVPVVFLLNELFPINAETSDILEEEFRKELVFKYRATPSVIGHMCIYEIKEFHKNMISYVVDLPILQKQEEGGNWNRIFKISKVQFQKLCTGNRYWTFIENDYEVVPNMKIKAGFFNFHYAALQEKFSNLIVNLVIKTQYRFKEEMIEAVFTPFAIIRSCSAKELKICFENMFVETNYLGIINNALKQCDDESCYVAIHRSIVYNFSMFTGIFFIRLMQDNSLQGNFRLYNEKQFIPEFYESIEKIFGKSKNNYSSFDEGKYLYRFLTLPKIKAVKIEYDRNFDIGNLKLTDYSEKDIFAAVYEKIIYTRRHYKSKQFFWSEELENFLNQRIWLKNKENPSDVFTRIIHIMLNKSILSNQVIYDAREKIVYRGYRYGENSDLLLPYRMDIFYEGIYNYYKRTKKEKYLDKLDYFLICFKQFLQKNGLLGYIITKREFEFFSRYFGDLRNDEICAQIENKLYLRDKEYLECYSTYERGALEKIRNFVENLEL